MTWATATAEVARRDPALAVVIGRAGPARLRTKDPDGPFGALVRAIIYQQLAGRAAAAIHGRVRALVAETLTPEAVLALSEEALRGAGLSAAKTRRCGTCRCERRPGSWPCPASVACPTTRSSPA